MSQRQYLVAGNWKMHGSRTQASELSQAIAAGAIAGVDTLICPPAVYLGLAAEQLAGSPVQLGAQDLSRWPDSGAFTGELSARMLQDVGCTAVIIGHSERRGLLAESDDVIAEKFERSLAAGLLPILCLGETLAEREDGDTEAVVLRQLAVVIERCGVASLGRGVIAYEPVWAIGTGRTATPEQAQTVHGVLRQAVAEKDATIAGSLRIVYGGSVKPDNAAELFAQPDVDGGLIGGAALDATSFLAICAAARDAN